MPYDDDAAESRIIDDFEEGKKFTNVMLLLQP